MTSAPNTAMVLAAGLGTRMRPLTDTKPKALIEVGGRALVDHVLDGLGGAGVARAVVNVHAFADQLEAHLASRARPQIVIADERSGLLETGGGLKKALPLVGPAPIWVANIDTIFSDAAASLEAMARAWDPGRMDVLLMLAPLERTLGFHDTGDVFLAADGRLRFKAAGELAPYVYVGRHITNPAIVSAGPEGPFSLLPIWKDLAERGRVFGLAPPGFCMHVGDPVALAAAEARLKEEGAAGPP